MTRYDTSTTLGWMDAIDTLKVVVIIVDRFFGICRFLLLFRTACFNYLINRGCCYCQLNFFIVVIVVVILGHPFICLSCVCFKKDLKVFL